MAQLDEKSQIISAMAYGSNRKVALFCSNSLGILRLAICLAPLFLAGCSSVPTAFNPVHWLDWAFDDSTDDEESVADSIVLPTGKSSTRPAEGLVGDNANTGYAAPIRRDVSETKPLVKQAPNSAVVQSVAAAAPIDNSVPSQAPSLTPPARPDVPSVVDSSSKVSMQDHYRQRLQESSSGTIASLQQPTSGFTGSDYTGSGARPIHLNPPKSSGSASSGMSGSSFQVSAINFRPGTTELTPSDLESLQEVARLYKKSGGSVRILGLGVGGISYQPVVISSKASAGPATSIGRAETIAKELTRLGVPGTKILVGAVAPGTPPSPDGAAARIYIDL
jgi:outer membrane protein OmpA-like peptidoglycan-associated protein